jgi:LysR family transcriptional regulator, glycine cleavage system transcriptional activator
MRTPRGHIPLKALRSFEAAARHMSFNDAATELGVTPSAVSLQIRRLEDLIGRPLFVRAHRSVSLSKTGARLAPMLITLFADMERLVSDVTESESSCLRLSAMPSFAARWLPPRLTRFSARHPDYQVRVEGDDSLADFVRDEIDVGLRYGPGGYADLHCEKIAAAVAFPVCSPAFAKQHAEVLTTPSSLLVLPLLHDEIAAIAPGLPNWNSWFEAAGVRRGRENRGPQFESLHMALAAAQSSQGVALGLTPLVNDDIGAGRLVRLFEIEVPSAFAFWFVCRADRLKQRKIADFRAWVISEMKSC